MLQVHNHSACYSWKRKKPLKCHRDTVNFDSKSLKQEMQEQYSGRQIHFALTCALSSPIYFTHKISLLYFFFFCNIDKGPTVHMSVWKKIFTAFAYLQSSDAKTQRASQSQNESEGSSWAQSEQDKEGSAAELVGAGGGECCIFL